MFQTIGKTLLIFATTAILQAQAKTLVLEYSAFRDHLHLGPKIHVADNVMQLMFHNEQTVIDSSKNQQTLSFTLIEKHNQSDDITRSVRESYVKKSLGDMSCHVYRDGIQSGSLTLDEKSERKFNPDSKIQWGKNWRWKCQARVEMDKIDLTSLPMSQDARDYTIDIDQFSVAKSTNPDQFSPKEIFDSILPTEESPEQVSRDHSLGQSPHFHYWKTERMNDQFYCRKLDVVVSPHLEEGSVPWQRTKAAILASKQYPMVTCHPNLKLDFNGRVFYPND